MSWSHITQTRINNVPFREPEDGRHNLYHSMENYHRRNRGFPMRRPTGQVIATRVDNFGKTPFRHRVPASEYRPTKPDTSCVWRSRGEPGMLQQRNTATDNALYALDKTVDVWKGTNRHSIGRHRPVRKERKSPEGIVLPNIVTARGIVCPAKTDGWSSLNVLTVSRPAVAARLPRTMTSPILEETECPDRLPSPCGLTRHEPARTEEGYNDPLKDSLTSLVHKVRSHHRDALRNGGESYINPKQNKLLTTSTVIDTDSYELFARTVPPGRQRWKYSDKLSNVQM